MVRWKVVVVTSRNILMRKMINETKEKGAAPVVCSLIPRNRFKIPAIHRGKKIFLEFEGVRQAGEFYLNGRFIGRHENGVMAFGFDITNLVKPYPAKNFIAVWTDNDWRYR